MGKLVVEVDDVTSELLSDTLKALKLMAKAAESAKFLPPELVKLETMTIEEFAGELVRKATMEIASLIVAPEKGKCPCVVCQLEESNIPTSDVIEIENASVNIRTFN